MPAPLASIIIPAYNPEQFLFEAIASALAQTHPQTEVVLVNDGSDKRESLAIIERASKLVNTYIEQPNRGLGAARNAGFLAARGEFVVPLDADDLLQPSYAAECVAALSGSEAAFTYTDFQVFGTKHFRERPGEYNLYRLLDRNYLSYAALIRKSDWEIVGGYDEPMKGYEDWDFWLRLAAHGRFGRYLPKALFRYRKHGPSMYDDARARHEQLVAYIRARHPELYEYENRARIKARWSPAATIISNEPVANETIEDIQVIGPHQLPLAPAVVNAMTAPLDPQAAELAALAAWGGNQAQRTTPDSSLGGNLFRHLLNAELFSWRSWAYHPARSLARLIPLRIKEAVNRVAARRVFDLSFYLQFQPNSVMFGDAVIEPLVYYPKPANGRKRVALVTTHLGPGGAEKVLYDFASIFSPHEFETLLFATQSRDDRWLTKWRARVDHVYDLARVVSPERMTAAVCSAVVNWRCDYMLLQNSLYGYSAIPHIDKLLPSIEIIDLNHYVDEGWDQIAATAAVAPRIDRRIALDETVRNRLITLGTPESEIVLLRNGVDLERFRPLGRARDASVKKILFAARLTPRKQPLLLPEIARDLCALRPQRDFRFVIAGDGPERDRLRRRTHKLGLDAMFQFRGQVDDLAPLLAECDLLVHPSRSEGVPLVVLESLATARPVVASKVGGIPEVLDSSCGVLVERLDSAAEFARPIHALLENDVLRETMGATGRRKMEAQHDIRKTLDALARLFHHNSAVPVPPTSTSSAMD